MVPHTPRVDSGVKAAQCAGNCVAVDRTPVTGVNTVHLEQSLTVRLDMYNVVTDYDRWSCTMSQWLLEVYILLQC